MPVRDSSASFTMNSARSRTSMNATRSSRLPGAGTSPPLRSALRFVHPEPLRPVLRVGHLEVRRIRFVVPTLQVRVVHAGRGREQVAPKANAEPFGALAHPVGI